MNKTIILIATHAFAVALGFIAGIYALPILAAPPAPADSEVRAAAANTQFTGEFRRNLADSDAVHWGDGTVYVGPDAVSLEGKIAPGPDYKLYFSPTFVETEADFMRLKSAMVRVGDVKTFDNFIVPLPTSVDVRAFNTVIVWCESFGEFITAAKYR